MSGAGRQDFTDKAGAALKVSTVFTWSQLPDVDGPPFVSLARLPEVHHRARR